MACPQGNLLLSHLFPVSLWLCHSREELSPNPEGWPYCPGRKLLGWPKKQEEGGKEEQASDFQPLAGKGLWEVGTVAK